MTTIQGTPLPAAVAILTIRNTFAVFGAWLVFKFLQALYNVSPFHPLSHIPGPKLAAATYLPEFYHDVIRFGCYSKEIRKMHEKYGPIVRINPNEVHCNDISFADEIYAVGGRKRDKPLHQINGSALGQAGFGTVSHDLHRLRRIPVAKFFSRAMILRLEPEIHVLVQKLCSKLLSQSGDGISFDVAMAYSCFTTDAISSYSFGTSFGLLDQTGWEPNFRAPTASVLRPVFVFRFFPWAKASVGLGKYLVDYMPADVALMVKTLQVDMPSRVRQAQADLDNGIVYERPTIFGELLKSDLEVLEKEPQRLADEAAAVIGAGTETGSWALSVITYHLLTKPQLLEKLTKELETVVEDPTNLPAWAVLETLPYLGAVIQEGLRLSYGVSSRTARIPTEENLLYRGERNKKSVEYVIPRGYAVGMSSIITHHDERAFPDSYAFIPERWLDENNERRKDVERSMLAFSKGSRGCLGMNLALCELHLCLAGLVLRVLPHMRLRDTTEEDVTYDYDMFIPMTKHNRGVRPTLALPNLITELYISPPLFSPESLSRDILKLCMSSILQVPSNPDLGLTHYSTLRVKPPAVDPTVRTSPTDGLPLAIVALSTIFLSLSVITVALRTYIRLKKGTFGIDDGFMIVGCVMYTVATALAIHGAFVGLGRLDVDLNPWQQSEAMKYYIIWILHYVLALATVKSSICITIMRIASTRINLRIAVYVLLAITWASFFITFIGTLLYCRPVRTIWTPQLILSGEGTCAPLATFVIIGHTATVSTIVTDLALVVLPAIMLWNTQMKRQAKLQAFGLLSFASVASIITMVRIPYVNKFEGMVDLPFWVAHTLLCSNIETGIGCIASSVPSLRHYFRRTGNESGSSGPSGGRPSALGIQTISQQRVRDIKRVDEWEVLQDGASDQELAPSVQHSVYEVDIEMKYREQPR
ncbi:cytochrome P450 [Ophiobolus disseminans]|uniref:Cytochrome P450 n=1 Tax=Ophiobolus disseminans TaxID=1469910 RepID=A0A6A7AAZ4_9PLEO|nr:cytochrome P450 [Ophiobolus disseminans]